MGTANFPPMKLLFIAYGGEKRALFLVLNDDGSTLTLLKNEDIDKGEIPLIRKMLPDLIDMPKEKRIQWFKPLKSYRACRRFDKTKITVLSQYDPKP